MPRNEAKRLDARDIFVQLNNRDRLADAGRVAVRYVKRDGTVSSSTGEVTFFNGRIGFDTGSVTITTEDKGARTINLHRIIEINDV